MRAYQLKIAIKNIKPPIWRRLIVPAGITFSQLSMILNNAMGWSGSHLSEFEFYHLELRIAEDGEEMDDWLFDPYDHAKASETYVRSYLDENGWFTYTYDFGDDWQHRVTVEKILDNYELNYPQVIKYKGACPPEDCGGVYGYGECLDALNNPDAPEYGDRIDWLNSMSWSQEYDMDYVNAEFERAYFYIWGKGESRILRALYQDMLDGKPGIYATVRDKNNKSKIKKSLMHNSEGNLLKLADKIKQMIDDPLKNMEYVLQTHEPKLYPLREMFSDFSKSDLTVIAKDKKMKVYSNYKKDKLIDCIIEHMLQPEIMEAYFLCLRDDEIEFFEKAMHSGNLYAPAEADNFIKLYCSSYIGMREDDSVVVSHEVAEQYKRMKTEEFDRCRRKRSCLLSCFAAAGELYGIVPADIMVKLYAANGKVVLTKQELCEEAEKIPCELAEFVYKDEKFYHKELILDNRGLLMVQADKPYYIPTWDEITSIAVLGYLPDSREFKKFIKFLTGSMGLDGEMADFTAAIIQQLIRHECTIDEVMNYLADQNILAGESQMRGLIEHISNLWNHTRMLTNRGHMPCELRNKAYTAKSDEKVISINRAARRKTYPNDPCPCGSGKKYKNCCGKK